MKKYIKYFIVIAMYAAGALLYTQLPDMVPSHWNFQGVADSFQPKMYGTWLLPTVALAMILLFPVFRKIDPKRENYESFARVWEIFQLGLVLFMAYVYAIQLYVALHPELSALVGRGITFGIGILFVIMGNYMGKIRQNFFVGMRTPWALSDPEVWSKSQRFAGWMFVIGGLLAIVESIVWLYSGLVFFGIVLVIALSPMIYSYLLYRGKGNVNSKALRSVLFLIVVLLFVTAAVVAGMRLLSSEDDWICKDGQWVQHGVPSAPMPTTPCQ